MKLAQLRQRADYTHRHNVRSGRHGWLRLTPAYSVKVVEEILSGCGTGSRVLDPFCGTGTTALCSATLGFRSATTDVNPFLVWLARVKTRAYPPASIVSAREACGAALEGMGKSWEPVGAPPIRNIGRWWSAPDLGFLRGLKGAIEGVAASKASKDLMLVAFCRTLIRLSNAAFNHQSMSFKDGGESGGAGTDRKELFRSELELVLGDCAEAIPSVPDVMLHDACDLGGEAFGRFDLVVTSPPYANRMSYVRELRPYMYWTGHLREAREAGELDWNSVAGTWGVATSRLNRWQPSGNYSNKHLASATRAISESEGKNGHVLSMYVLKYFEDIFRHLSSLPGVLSRGARVHYIVGNSTFYGTLVSVEEVYADMLETVGFADVGIRPIRKRNSKKELVEFEVSATW